MVWDMGTRSSKPQKQAHVLMLGLDSSGKTTLLYKLKFNENVWTVQTVGFNVESLDTDRSSLALILWDIGGQRKMRSYWKHFYPDAAGVLFVVDSWDQKRLEEAHKELHRALHHEALWGIPLVVLANKQDLAGALSAGALCEKLDLRRVLKPGQNPMRAEGNPHPALCVPLTLYAQRAAPPPPSTAPARPAFPVCTADSSRK
ncbi:hypothetical protein WMY93_028829 [Mugilogobius chulae]|uniref:ADP-ribosylation factor-like protein 14 n=1 Tax=Mugilogobius chulae TaxID=88201 RepID=A0AAW0MSX8_9GOBI